MRTAWVFLGATLLVAHVGSMLLAVSESSSARHELTSRFALLMAIGFWFRQYSRKYGIGWPLDMGLFLIAASFIVVPYHVLRAEGKRGLPTLAALVALYFGTYGLAVLLSYVLYSFRGT